MQILGSKNNFTNLLLSIQSHPIELLVSSSHPQVMGLDRGISQSYFLRHGCIRINVDVFCTLYMLLVITPRTQMGPQIWKIWPHKMDIVKTPPKGGQLGSRFIIIVFHIQSLKIQKRIFYNLGTHKFQPQKPIGFETARLFHESDRSDPWLVDLFHLFRGRSQPTSKDYNPFTTLLLYKYHGYKYHGHPSVTKHFRYQKTL